MKEENQDEEPDYRLFKGTDLNRLVAILFVFAIYLVIFLKILVLE